MSDAPTGRAALVTPDPPPHTCGALRTRADVLQVLRAEQGTLRQRYGVARLGLCGSFGRDAATDASDVDLLVTFTARPTLYDVVRLKHHLEAALGRPVDLGMPSALGDGPAAAALRREACYLDI